MIYGGAICQNLFAISYFNLLLVSDDAQWFSCCMEILNVTQCNPFQFDFSQIEMD